MLKKRLLKNVKLFVEGNTIEEIVASIGTNYLVVCRDIKNRLNHVVNQI